MILDSSSLVLGGKKEAVLGLLRSRMILKNQGFKNRLPLLKAGVLVFMHLKKDNVIKEKSVKIPWQLLSVWIWRLHLKNVLQCIRILFHCNKFVELLPLTAFIFSFLSSIKGINEHIVEMVRKCRSLHYIVLKCGYVQKLSLPAL